MGSASSTNTSEKQQQQMLAESLFQACQREMKKQHWRRAEAAALQSLRLYQNLQDSVRLIQVHQALSTISSNLGDTCKSIDHLQEVMNHQQELKLYTEASGTALIISQMYQSMGKPMEAGASLTKANTLRHYIEPNTQHI